MKEIVEFGLWVYKYATDFCLNAANLMGIDYVTFGSIFFGGVMNGVILILIILNVMVSRKKRRMKELSHSSTS